MKILEILTENPAENEVGIIFRGRYRSRSSLKILLKIFTDYLKMNIVKRLARGCWQLVSYLFWPQRRNNGYGQE